MKKNVRFVLAIIVLSVSLSLLIWGYMPNPLEVRVRPIPPGEMQLP